MPTLADKISFAQKHIRTPDGEPFSLEGRQWVLDELWRPLDGWKLWPVQKGSLCSSCSDRAGKLTEDYHASDETRTPKHAATGCAGLKSEPIVIVAEFLKRQTGKTFNVAAWAMSRAFKDKRESIALLAGSEAQVERLYNKNYKKPIEGSRALSKRAHCLGTRIHVESTDSDIEILPTAMSSVGDTRTVVILDECRVVPPDIAVAMIPTLFARGGWQCPDYHVRTHAGVSDASAPKECSVCGKATEPWHGKALLLSSAGELDDSEADWFFEFVEYYQKNPHPNVHVFASSETLNPKVSQKMVDVTVEVFGALESTKVYANIEGSNEPGRKDDDVLTPAEVKRCADPKLENLDECALPCVGFLDTALVVEKISLVTLAQDPASLTPWEKVFTPRIDFWLPSEMRGGVADEDVIYAHLAKVLPLYTGLRELNFDVRTGATGGETWGRRVVAKLRKDGFRVVIWEKTSQHESHAGWAELIKRIRQTTIRYLDLPEIHREIRGVTTRRRGEVSAVVDKNRKKSHKDITEGLALCCYLAALEVLKGGRVGMARIRQIGAEVSARRAGIRGPQDGRVRLPSGSITKGFGPDSY